MTHRYSIYKVTVLILFFTTVFAGFLNASGELSGGLGGFDFGMSFQNQGDLNAALSAQGYSPVTENFNGLIGGGGGGFVQNVYFGGKGFSIRHRMMDNDQNYLSINQGMGYFETGYAVFHNPTLIIVPLIGIGGSSLNIDTAPASYDHNDFSSIIADPGHSSSISMQCMSFEGGVDTYVRMGFTYLKIGLMYAYQYNPEWSLSGHSEGHSEVRVLNAPSVDPHLVYLTAGIYFGGTSESRKSKSKSFRPSPKHRIDSFFDDPFFDDQDVEEEWEEPEYREEAERIPQDEAPEHLRENTRRVLDDISESETSESSPDTETEVKPKELIEEE